MLELSKKDAQISEIEKANALLRRNLGLQKEIISNLLDENISKFFLIKEKFELENKMLSDRLVELEQKLSNEIALHDCENVYPSLISHVDFLEEKLFLLENKLSEALNNLRQTDKFLEPTRTTVKLNDEIEQMKELNRNLNEKLAEATEKANNYSKYVCLLKTEYLKIRESKAKEVFSIKNELGASTLGSSREDLKRQIYNSEDWIEILKILKLNIIDIEEFFEVEENQVITEMIELLSKVIVEKNWEIKEIKRRLNEKEKEIVKMRENKATPKERIDFDFEDVSEISFITREKKRVGRKLVWKRKIVKTKAANGAEKLNILKQMEKKLLPKYFNTEDLSNILPKRGVS